MTVCDVASSPECLTPHARTQMNTLHSWFVTNRLSWNFTKISDMIVYTKPYSWYSSSSYTTQTWACFYHQILRLKHWRSTECPLEKKEMYLKYGIVFIYHWLVHPPLMYVVTTGSSSGKTSLPPVVMAHRLVGRLDADVSFLSHTVNIQILKFPETEVYIQIFPHVYLRK